jgi:hypothetical protein
MNYLLNILVLLSQIINTVFLFGDADMTVSARCYINRDKKSWGRAYKIINTVFFFQENHCRSSFAADIKYAKTVIGYAAQVS